MGPPGASVAGRPVRLLCVLCAGGLARARLVLLGGGHGADLPRPHSLGSGEAQPLSGKPTRSGEGRAHK